MSIEDSKKKIEELVLAVEEARNKMRKEISELFKEVVKEFFLENPGIKAIVWNQYTPYWNDGDECTFSINGFNFTTAEGEDLKDNIASISWGDDEAELPAGFNEHEMSSILNKIPDDIFRDMFGDHVVVAVTSTGDILIEEYDHE